MRIRNGGPGVIATTLNVPVYIDTVFTCYIPESVQVIKPWSDPGIPKSKPSIVCSGDYIAKEGLDYTIGPWRYLNETGSGYQYQAKVTRIHPVGVSFATVGFMEWLLSAPLKSLTSVEQTVIASRDTIEMHDVVTPSYKKDSALGRVIMSPMKKFTVYQSVNPLILYSPNQVITFKAPYYGVLSVTMGRRNTTTGLSCPVPIYPELPSTDSVVAEAFAKLQKADLDVAMMAAEGQETLQYLQVLAKRALKLYELFSSPKTIMKVAPRTYARLKKLSPTGKVKWGTAELAQAWLELRYALRPLLMDIEDITLFLLEPAKVKGERQTFRRRSVSMGSPRKVDTIHGLSGEFFVTEDIEVSAGVLAELKVDPGSVSFGFTNWASVIWEKIPYSFILDWIINISGAIYMLNPNCTWKVLGAWATAQITETVTGFVPVVGPDGNPVKTQYLSRITHRERSVDIKQPPLISVNVEIDTFKMLDLAALARGIKWNHSTLRL